jgi:hypothetical protein
LTDKNLAHSLVSEQQQQSYNPEQQQHEIQWKTEEPFWIIPTKDPDNFVCADGPDPNHFMPWIYPFTSVISGPIGSGKSVFVKRFVENMV